MPKFILLCLLSVSVAYSSSEYSGGSLAPCIMAGAVVKHEGDQLEKKYPRKSCPVCKGTGKYLSGDGIKMVDCGYCEPEKTEQNNEKISGKKSPFCKCPDCKCNDCQCKPKGLTILQK